MSDFYAVGGGIATGSVDNIARGPGAIGYLDPEIAGEGFKAVEGLMTEGDAETPWRPQEVEARLPSFKTKKNAYLFEKKAFKAFPAMIYHPDKEKPIIVKSNEEALKYGVFFRETTNDEKARFQGLRYVWDFLESTKWRATPFERHLGVNPHNSGQKIVVTGDRTQANQDNLVSKLIPEVAAAVAAALKMTGAAAAPAAPAGKREIDPDLWDRFQQFVAFEETQRVVAKQSHALTDGEPEEAAGEPEGASGTETAPTDEYALWASEAERLGVHIDKRWGLERLQKEVEKASAA
jgi:hypothetical protein